MLVVVLRASYHLHASGVRQHIVSRLTSYLDQVVEDSQPLWILTLLHLHSDGPDK